jgi:hypothetical protein
MSKQDMVNEQVETININLGEIDSLPATNARPIGDEDANDYCRWGDDGGNNLD